jgi:hypothetical protein
LLSVNLPGARAVLVLVAIGATPAAAQVAPISVDSAVSINRFGGQHAADQPDVVIDVTATVRLGKGWVAYARPWFRRASSDPYNVAKEIYQAALQYQRSGPVSTRIDLGYILSPIGLGMLDMRPDTNPTIMPHLSYLVPMPSFDPGAPSALPIAASYPLGAQYTTSTARWDARAAVVSSPPNRPFVLNAGTPNPRSRPTVVVGGGITPKTGLRLGLAYAGGAYATTQELTRAPANGRHLHMVSAEGEFAFGYTKLTGEFTRDRLDTGIGHAVATEWFLQGSQSLTPRWFAAARYEGANAPPRSVGQAAPTLRMSEITAGFRLSREFTVRSSVARRKTYFSPRADLQVGASLVWARRWL